MNMDPGLGFIADLQPNFGKMTSLLKSFLIFKMRIDHYVSTWGPWNQWSLERRWEKKPGSLMAKYIGSVQLWHLIVCDLGQVS